MTKEYIIFNDNLSDFGGSTELIRRMCHWLIENGYSVMIIAQGDKNKELKNDLLSIGVKVAVMDDRKIKKVVNLLSSITEQLKVISFTLDHFMRMEMAKKKGLLSFSNILYVIHPEAFTKGSHYDLNFLKKLGISLYSNIYKILNNNRSIIMENREYLRVTLKYLKLENEKSPNICSIPYRCKQLGNIERVIRNGFQSQTLMTAARAEFPLKAYMLKLIEAYAILKKKYHDLKLEIVSDGECYNELHEKVQEVNQRCGGITLHKWMQYDALLKLMEECKIYIGLGTTVLEAASRYKPALPTVENIHACRAINYFSEIPECICFCDKSQDIIPLIEEGLNWNFDEYKEQCYKSYEALVTNYDTDVVMKFFIGYTVNEKNCIIPTKYFILQEIIDIKNTLMMYGKTK